MKSEQSVRFINIQMVAQYNSSRNSWWVFSRESLLPYPIITHLEPGAIRILQSNHSITICSAGGNRHPIAEVCGGLNDIGLSWFPRDLQLGISIVQNNRLRHFSPHCPRPSCPVMFNCL